MGSGKACSGAAGVLACRIASVNCKTRIINRSRRRAQSRPLFDSSESAHAPSGGGGQTGESGPRADESGQRQRRREIPKKTKREIINARPPRPTKRARRASRLWRASRKARRKPRAAAKRRSAQSAARTPRQKARRFGGCRQGAKSPPAKCEVAIARGLTKNAAKTSGVSPPRHSKFENRKSRRDDSLTSITRASCKSQNESAAPPFSRQCARGASMTAVKRAVGEMR